MGPPSKVVPKCVELTMADAGFDETTISGWTDMNYLVVDPGNPMGATPGEGTVDVTGDWGVTVTVIYFGDNAEEVGAFENKTVIPTLTDGPTILVSEVETIIIGGNQGPG